MLFAYYLGVSSENPDVLATMKIYIVLTIFGKNNFKRIENNNFAGDDCDVGALVREESPAHTYHR